MEVQTIGPHEYNKWDSFVDQSPQGDVFCYSWWLEAITGSNFRILVIYDNNEIVAGIPLAFDALNKINIPPLTRTLGVLYKKQDYQSDRRKTSVERKWLFELLKHIPLNDFIQMCLHHNFTDWLPFRWNGFSQTTRYTYIINYRNKTISGLWNNLDLETKRVVKRAGEKGIRIERTDDFDLIYRYESLSYERQGLKFRIPYNDLKSLDDTIKERGNRVIFKAIDNHNQVHAVLYVAFNQKSAYALLSGSDATLRKLGGHTLVMWEAVRYFSDKVEYFNFGGSDIEQIEAHLRGFGGTLTPYFHIYNEKLMWKRNDIRYHIGETSFHLFEVLKIVKNKLLKTMRRS
jgi:lipid II:glycine glycyltransferase (peptidoglycan interpeptide bridge formation enzyme)